MGYAQFPIRKGGIFCPGKEIKGLRGGVRPYAAQASLKIYTARAERTLFGRKLVQLFPFAGNRLFRLLFLLPTGPHGSNLRKRGEPKGGQVDMGEEKRTE